MARYVLNIDSKIQLNKSELDKVARQINKAFSAGNFSDAFTKKETAALQKLRRELDKINESSSKLGTGATRGLKFELNSLKKILQDTSDPKRFDKFEAGLREVAQAFREATKAAKELDRVAEQTVRDAEAAIARRSRISGLNRTRQSRQARRNELVAEAREALRVQSDAIQKSKLSSADQSKLLSGFGGIDSGLNSKAGRSRAREFIRDKKREFKELLDAQTEADKDALAATKAADDAAKKAKKDADALAARNSEIAATSRRRRTRQANRNRAQKGVQEDLRDLSDAIQKSKIPAAEQAKLLAPFGGINSRTNSKEGRQAANDFIRDTKRQFKELTAAQNELDKADKERERRKARAAKAKTKRLKEEEREGAFGFGKQSALAFRRFAAFSIAASAAFEVQAALRSAVGEAIEFQDQMVKIGQVTGRSTANLDEFTNKITQLSTGLGVSSNELANSALLIAQAGFNLSETQTTLETLAKAQLTPSFNNLDNTTEGLIALRSQFGLTADQFESTLGSINSVSKAFAVESEDIITAIRKSGGAFNVAGGDINELIALFTAVRSSTRETADTIAVGFRTIFGRLQRPAIIEELRRFNIELQDGGNFVGPLEAIGRINRALAQIPQGNEQFARIVEQIGGIRQISKVVPLIKQFGTAQTALNIAKLGTNSLDEDAARRQKSLQIQLNRTKETFLTFVRSIGDQNSALGKTFTFLNDRLQTFIQSLSSLSGLATPLSFILGFSALKGASNFGGGFLSGLNLVGGKQDRSLLKRGGESVFRNTGILGKRDFPLSTRLALVNRNLGGGLALGAGALAAGGLFAAGNALKPNTLTRGNRNQFAFGGALEEAAAGASFGGLVGASVGGIPGAAIGAALGGLIAGINGFANAVKLAEQQLAKTEFDKTFTKFTQTVGFINSGRITPLGAGGSLRQTIGAIEARRFTATGDFRDELEGNIAELVQQLLTFNQKLAESSKTMDQFNAAGGAESIQFIANNSTLTEVELKKSVQDIIDAAREADKLEKNFSALNEKLLQEQNLITAFNNALLDAADAATKLSNDFDIASQSFNGGTGFNFTGRPGFNNAFARPGRIGNVGQFGAASAQLEGLLGGAAPGLAAQNSATASLFQQLPAILSEFALSRPSGNIDDAIDDFVKQRLESIAKGAPPGSLDTIIDSITSALSAEAGGEGGQSKLINKILENTTEFVNELIDRSGAETARKFQQEAANAIIEQFNRFAGQLKDVTDREIELREQIVENELNFSSRMAELGVLKNPRGTIDPTIAEAANTGQARRILDSVGLNNFQKFQNFDPAGIETQRQAELRKSIDLQKQINEANSPEVAQKLAEELSKTQQRAAALGVAFKLVTDTAARRAAIEQALSKAQNARQQFTSGFGDFVFGNKQGQAQLNLGAVLTQVAARPGGFNQIANFAGDPNRELPGVLDQFLQRFSDVDIRGIGNLGELRRNLIEEQLTPVFREIIAGQFAPRDRKKNAALIDDEAKKAAALAADKAVSDPEKELIAQLEDLAKKDFDNQNILLTGIGIQNQFLITNLNTSIQKFFADLARNTTQQELAGQEAKLLNVKNQKKGVLNSKADLSQILNLGGSPNNTNNLQALAFAEQLRKLPNNEILDAQNLQNNARVANVLQGENGPLLQAMLAEKTNQLDFVKDLRNNGAQSAGLRFANEFQPGNLTPQEITNLVSKEVAEFNESQLHFGNNQSPVELEGDILEAITDAAIKKQSEELAARAGVFDSINATQNPQIKDLTLNLIQLSEKDFTGIANSIRGLGATDLSALNRSIHDFNDQITRTTDNINALQLKLQGGGQAQPNNQNNGPQAFNDAAQQFNQGINGFVGQSASLVTAMDNFPRTVDLSATHRVEVVFNGHQVLQNLTPAMQEIATTAANDAISKFIKEKMPGAGAVG